MNLSVDWTSGLQVDQPIRRDIQATQRNMILVLLLCTMPIGTPGYCQPETPRYSSQLGLDPRGMAGVADFQSVKTLRDELSDNSFPTSFSEVGCNGNTAN